MGKSVEEQVEDIEKKYEEMVEDIDYLFGQNGFDSDDLYELRRDIKELKRSVYSKRDKNKKRGRCKW